MTSNVHLHKCTRALVVTTVTCTCIYTCMYKILCTMYICTCICTCTHVYSVAYCVRVVGKPIHVRVDSCGVHPRMTQYNSPSPSSFHACTSIRTISYAVTIQCLKGSTLKGISVVLLLMQYSSEGLS